MNSYLIARGGWTPVRNAFSNERGWRDPILGCWASEAWALRVQNGRDAANTPVANVPTKRSDA